MDIQALVEKQRSYFATGSTRPVVFRLQALERLREEIRNGSRRSMRR